MKAWMIKHETEYKLLPYWEKERAQIYFDIEEAMADYDSLKTHIKNPENLRLIEIEFEPKELEVSE